MGLWVVRVVFCPAWSIGKSVASSVQLGTFLFQPRALGSMELLLSSLGLWAVRDVFCPLWEFEQSGASPVQPRALGSEAVMLMSLLQWHSALAE